jgi:hypothetical protein
MPNLNRQVLLKRRGRNGPDMLTYVATKLLKFIKTIMTKNNYIFKSIIIPKSETDLGYYLAGQKMFRQCFRFMQLKKHLNFKG